MAKAGKDLAWKTAKLLKSKTRTYILFLYRIYSKKTRKNLFVRYEDFYFFFLLTSFILISFILYNFEVGGGLAIGVKNLCTQLFLTINKTKKTIQSTLNLFFTLHLQIKISIVSFNLWPNGLPVPPLLMAPEILS